MYNRLGEQPVCVTKPNGEIRLCLDPKDLNKYIKRPHYYSPRIDDVLLDLCGSKYFSTLNARFILIVDNAFIIHIMIPNKCLNHL